jgi:hypothetical protein
MQVRAVFRRFGCYWRKESGVKLRKLLRGSDFVDDGLRRGARVGGRKNWPANHKEVRTRANRFGRCSFPGLIF